MHRDTRLSEEEGEGEAVEPAAVPADNEDDDGDNGDAEEEDEIEELEGVVDSDASAENAAVLHSALCLFQSCF